jgi:hypothetical protein
LVPGYGRAVISGLKARALLDIENQTLIAMSKPSNFQIAEMLEHVAQLLQIEEADTFRIAAYRRAARAVLEADQPLSEILAAEGPLGLRRVAGVGPTIGSAIQEYIETGRFGMLERLTAEAPPEALFTLVPGIGPELGRRIAGQLRLETLEDLELAAHDGRLAAVPGFGERRTKLVRDALAGILPRSVPRLGPARAIPSLTPPPVEVILDVDAEYRRRAQAGELKRIAPRRFNQERKAWLPLLHTERGRWSFTALFSNTARAHELGKTGDWVVLFYERGNDAGQCTVVTERRGLMAGRRVVRGREAECRAFYYLGQSSPKASPDHPNHDGPIVAAG